MTNPVSESDLQAFVDGELSKERLREVLVYLGTCPHEIPRIACYLVQKDELRRRLDAVAWAGEEPKTWDVERELAQELERSAPRPWPWRGPAVGLLLTIGGGVTRFPKRIWRRVCRRWWRRRSRSTRCSAPTCSTRSSS